MVDDRGGGGVTVLPSQGSGLLAEAEHIYHVPVFGDLAVLDPVHVYPRNTNVLPVGGMPRNSPRWMPVRLQRSTTRSSSAMASWIVHCGSRARNRAAARCCGVVQVAGCGHLV
jgi:hypothetical protein